MICLMVHQLLRSFVSQPSLASAGLDPETIRQQVALEFKHRTDMPFEIVLKGAWSVVLSRLSATRDVVFGEFTDCRHMSLENDQPISNVVGPLGNIIPVRLRLPAMSVSPHDYLESIHS
ncbi:hypothetical protein HD806DRAFT_117167 [Xylariaceae sp. AK1471]|nr:hypothetical protein HD806DRAFT_117167 [Xylariaceae sp. AK1471]